MTNTSPKPETIGIPELAALVSERHDLTKARSKSVLDDVRDQVVSALLAGKRVAIFGLGAFEVRATKAKMGRNPKTGAQIQIPEGRKVVFRAAKGIKDKM